MSDSSWWQRHLGEALGQQPAPASHGPAVRWQPQYPPTGPRQEVTGGDPGDQSQPGGNGDSSYNSVQQQGFVAKPPANVGKVGQCPGCGGSNFFQRKWAHTAAAPLCTDCGYNGDLFTQSGTLLNAVGMRSAGPVAIARTDNPGGQSHFGIDPSVPGDFNWGSVR